VKKTKIFASGAVAAISVIAGLSAACTIVYADTQSVPNPIPTQIVLNQTNVDGVPMVTNSDTHAPSIISDAAVVMDMSTGTLVFAKNPNRLHYPASITKIMTAMIALQRGHLDDSLVASQTACNQEPDKLYLVPGESEPLGKLLYGLLLNSANDAAVVIAEHYGESVQGFADLMNQEANSLGAEHTHFVNPNGLPNPNHVTTAYDMSLITRAAMQYSTFRDLVQTREYHWQGEKWQSELTNLNKMLYYYPGAIGVKTGFTSVAHNTLVVAATRNHETYLAVLMDAPTNFEIRNDAAKIMDYAFTHYHTQTFLAKGTVVSTVFPSPGQEIPVSTTADLVATSPIRDDMNVQTKVALDVISHDLPAGARVGWLQVEQAGHQIASVPLVSTQPIFLHKAEESAPLSHESMYWLVGGVCLLMVLIGTFWVYRRRQLQLNASNWSTPSV
jgi:D-alanyl-D-alanine carboxypeptidase (penicillin-binding protein 5/6)